MLVSIWFWARLACLFVLFLPGPAPAPAAAAPGSPGIATPQTDAPPLAADLSGDAFHCATAFAAFALAYRHAAGLLQLEDVPVPAALPPSLLALAGGRERLPEITEEAVTGWRPHWESMARTRFYPLLAARGTPYLADDGLALMREVRRCTDRFAL